MGNPYHPAIMLPAANDAPPLAPFLRPERAASPRLAKRRIVARACLDEALREAGVTNGQVARWLGVDEKIVRQMRAGLKPCALEDLASLPPRTRALVLERLRAA